jgi:hypothetical protein
MKFCLKEENKSRDTTSNSTTSTTLVVEEEASSSSVFGKFFGGILGYSSEEKIVISPIQESKNFLFSKLSEVNSPVNSHTLDVECLVQDLEFH